MKILIFSSILFFVFVFASLAVCSAEYIYVFEDARGDDYGPGSYQYPLHSDFAPYEGLFDITQFIIEEEKEHYIFTFSFVKLNNPWNKKNGFSHPLIEMYIDNQQGGSIESFRQAARVKFDKENPWNKLLKISGEFVRLYTPEDEELEEMVSLQEDMTIYSRDLKDVDIKVEESDIILKVKKDIIGSLAGQHVYLLVGSFDPFGDGYFRDIRSQPANWFFHDPGQSPAELDYSPRVIDIILPDGISQEDILSDFSQGSFASVYPLKIELVDEETSPDKLVGQEIEQKGDLEDLEDLETGYIQDKDQDRDQDTPGQVEELSKELSDEEDIHIPYNLLIYLMIIMLALILLFIIKNADEFFKNISII